MSPRYAATLVLAALALIACSKDSPTDPVPNVQPNPPAPPPAPPAPPPPPTVSYDNRVLLFVVPSSTSSSSYVHEYGITLEASTQYLIRYVPSLAKAEVVDKNYSPSYAPSSEYWYSVDDRLFIGQEWRPYETGGHHDFSERRYDTFASVRSFDVRYPMSHNTGCSAVVGDTYFFRTERNSDLFAGYVGGDFYRKQISTGVTQKLMTYGDAQNCFFNMMASGDALYDVLALPRDLPTSFGLFERDLATGKPSLRPIIGLSESAPAEYVAWSYHFAIDRGVFYTARTRKADGAVEVWKMTFSPSVDAEPTKILDATLGLSARVLEVDDGHLMLADLNGGKVFLWDIASNEKKTIDFGVSLTNVTQIFVKK
jgi:hypothetical protein